METLLWLDDERDPADTRDNKTINQNDGFSWIWDGKSNPALLKSFARAVDGR